MTAPLRFRSPELVVEILGLVYDRAEEEPPIGWIELVVGLSDSNQWKTVENTIYELVAFGALHRIGRPAQGRRGIDTRALKPTALGRAWLDRELLELPGA